MIKKLAFLVVLLAAGLTYADPASDYLDSKFEAYWKGSEEAEKTDIANVGKVIGEFIQATAKIREGWFQDFQAIEAIPIANRTAKENEKLKAYREIFGDLPDRKTFATRDVHRKTHGCVKAKFTVNQDVSKDVAFGIFEKGGSTYDAIVRYSNGNPRNQNDSASDARGMAVKFLKSETLKGDLAEMKAPDLTKGTLLDILAINIPVFFVNDPKVYTKVNEDFLVKSSDVLSSFDYKFGEFKAIFTDGMSWKETLLALMSNGSIIQNPLSQTYWSMAAFRLGKFSDPNRTAVKYIWRPCGETPESESWTKMRDYSIPVGGAMKRIPKAVVEEMKADGNFLRKQLGGSLDPVQWETNPEKPKRCFFLYTQKFIDNENTPVEDTTEIWIESEQQKKDWPEAFLDTGCIADLLWGGAIKEIKANTKNRKVSTPIQIGKLDLSPMTRDEIDNPKGRNYQTCEDLSFNPWNNAADEHKPLGIVNRMRKAAYGASRDNRHEINQVGK